MQSTGGSEVLLSVRHSRVVPTMRAMTGTLPAAAAVVV
jgi:hypothetical protein